METAFHLATGRALTINNKGKTSFKRCQVFFLEMEEASPDLINTSPLSEHKERQVTENSLGKTNE